MNGATDRAVEFAEHRDYLVRIAYRLLGSIDEAEDVVQDALLRASATSSRDIDEPVAWLTKIVTNRALDLLKSARVRHEAYVGPWLPEPIVGRPWGPKSIDPADRVTLDEQISLALLAVLETLSPAERAVFVLHEAFGVPLAEVATIVGRSPQACRQLAVRARKHVEDRQPRFDAAPEEQARLVSAFQRACEDGDLEALTRMLDRDVVFRSDGGGVVTAALRPLVGRARVLQTLRGSLRNTPGLMFERREVNGAFGLVARFDTGLAVLAFGVRDGVIVQIDVVANPEKLGHVPPSA
jgi:RNA polymerase sigma-70 factor (ECF subfamily)